MAQDERPRGLMFHAARTAGEVMARARDERILKIITGEDDE